MSTGHQDSSSSPPSVARPRVRGTFQGTVTGALVTAVSGAAPHSVSLRGWKGATLTIGTTTYNTLTASSTVFPVAIKGDISFESGGHKQPMGLSGKGRVLRVRLANDSTSPLYQFVLTEDDLGRLQDSLGF